MKTAPAKVHRPQPPRRLARKRLRWWVRQFLARCAAGPARRPGSKEPPIAALRQQRIALVKWDAIGDFVLATSLLRLLHERLAPERITLFCRSGVDGLARTQFPGWRIVTLPPRLKPLRQIYLQPRVRRLLKSQEPFDLLIDLRAMRDMGDSVLTSWIPARMKIGLANQYELGEVPLPGEEHLYDRLYPKPIPPNPEVPQDLQNYRFLAEQLFPGESGMGTILPRMKVTEEARAAMTRRLADQDGLDGRRPFLLVCPGSLDPIKEYPPDQLAQAIRLVLGRHPSLPVVLAGSQADARTIVPLQVALVGTGLVHDLRGRFDLAQHAVLVSLAAAVLCMDSGTAHLAGALGRRAVVVLGGGQPGLFAPWGASDRFRWLRKPLPCYGCNWLCTNDRPICIQDIPSEEIARNLLEILQDPH